MLLLLHNSTPGVKLPITRIRGTTEFLLYVVVLIIVIAISSRMIISYLDFESHATM